MSPLQGHELIDARVRFPSALRDYQDKLYEDYNAALGVHDAWMKPIGDLESELDAAGVAHAIVHAEYEVGDLADQLNEEVAKYVAADPDRFTGYGTVTIHPGNAMRMVRQVERIGALGLRGVNLQPAFFGLAIDDRVLYPVYAKAIESNLAIGLHTGINYSRRCPIDNERPVRLDQVACDFPEAVLIACHGAWPWIDEMVAVALRHPNVMIDFGGLSPRYIGVAGSGWETMLRFMDRGLRDRILFATDWPVFGHRRAVDEWLDLGLRDETLVALFGGNARRLLARATPTDA